MVPAPLLNENALDLLISFDIDGETHPSDAIVDAFLAAGVAVFEKSTTLGDWIDPHALDELMGRSNDGPLFVSTRVWSHRVVLTTGSVRIYAGTVTPPETPYRIDKTLH